MMMLLGRISDGDRHRLLRRALPDDVAVELGHDLPRRQLLEPGERLDDVRRGSLLFLRNLAVSHRASPGRARPPALPGRRARHVAVDREERFALGVAPDRPGPPETLALQAAGGVPPHRRAPRA
jgi:hypothetical protein